jgi:hypothetical protein
MVSEECSDTVMSDTVKNSADENVFTFLNENIDGGRDACSKYGGFNFEPLRGERGQGRWLWLRRHLLCPNRLTEKRRRYDRCDARPIAPAYPMTPRIPDIHVPLLFVYDKVIIIYQSTAVKGEGFEPPRAARL